MDHTDFCLSSKLNAVGASLPMVRIRQQYCQYNANLYKIIDKRVEDDMSANGSLAFYTNEIIFVGSKTGGKHAIKDEKITVGSTAEGLRELGIDVNPNDVDIIVVVGDFKIYEHINDNGFVKSFDITINPVLRLPDKTYPGYAKLAVLQINDHYKKYYHHQGGNIFLKNIFKERMLIESTLTEFSIHGPAVTAKFLYRDIVSLSLQNNNKDVAYVVEKSKYNERGDTDLVFCLNGEKWPVEALEWTTRRRSSNWPTKDLYDNILNSGYLLAGVGHKESNESELQWRVSFNKAEQLIFESLNETQIHCICLLKWYKTSRLSKVAGKNITSYSMKTVMFWCLEDKCEEFWQSTNLVSCVCFCMSKLKCFVEDRFLPNYFIRERNQLSVKEFSLEIKTKTIQCLDCFLEDPKTLITKLISTYIDVERENYSLPVLHEVSELKFFETWLVWRIRMALKYHSISMNAYWQLFVGKSIENSLHRCNGILEELTGVNYAQPFIKLFQNVMAVLHYIILKRKKETCSNERAQYLNYMRLSLAEDNSHINLRIATCYLDEGVKEECINIIRTVTDHPGNYMSMESYAQHVEQMYTSTIIDFRNRTTPFFDVREIPMYHRIIEKDLIDQDPYRTIKVFEQLKREGIDLLVFDAYLLVWNRCWFNVTFIHVEMPVLPKPAALELCIDISRKHISFHPYLYGLLLEFLWHAKNGSTNEERKSILKKMKKCVSKLQRVHQSIGRNFITYCYSLQKDYCSAAKYVMQSLKLNLVKQNVAYMYVMYIIKILRITLLGNASEGSLWLNLMGIEWDID